MIEANRAATRAFIMNDPTIVTLTPRVRSLSAAGTAVYTNGPVREPQTVKLSLLAFDQRPTVTLAGVARLADYHLVAEHDAVIEVGDYWEDEAGTRFDVVSETEGWDYMRKFVVVRTIPREANP